MYEYAIGFTVFYFSTVMGDSILQQPIQKSPVNQAYIPTQPTPVSGNNVPNSNGYRKFDIPLQYVVQNQKPATCVNSQLLIVILNNLLKILSDGKETLPPNVIDKINEELDLIKKYINEMPIGFENAEILEKFKRLQEQFHKDSGALAQPQDKRQGSSMKVVFKYEIPGIDQLRCRQALITLMEVAYSAYVNLINHPICQGAGIETQNNQPVIGDYLQNGIQYNSFQVVPNNNQGFASSNQQYQTNLYGQANAGNNARPNDLNLQNNANSLNFESGYSQNIINSQSNTASSNSQLLVQPLQPHIESANYIQQEVESNSGYQLNNNFKQPLLSPTIYDLNNLQIPAENELTSYNTNNYYSIPINIPYSYQTPQQSISSDSSYSYNNIHYTPPNIQPTRPASLDQEKTNFNNIIYNSNEDEFTTNLQHAKYVAESMAQAIKSLHVSQNAPAKNTNSVNNIQNNNMLLSNGNQVSLTVPNQISTNEKFIVAHPLMNFQNIFPTKGSHGELLNIHYEKIPMRQTAEQVENSGSQQLSDGKQNRIMTGYAQNNKRNNDVHQRDGLEDQENGQHNPELNNKDFNPPFTPPSITGPFGGNNEFKLPPSLPTPDSNPHTSLNPIIENIATFNIKNDRLNLTSTSKQINDPNSNRITNQFQGDLYSSYPNSLAIFNNPNLNAAGDNLNSDLNQNQDELLQPNNNPNVNHFENNFPNLSEQFQNLNANSNQFQHLNSSNPFQNPNSISNNQVHLGNPNSIQSQSKYSIQMQNAKPNFNQNPILGAGQMQNLNPNLNDNPFFELNYNQNPFYDPNQIEHQQLQNPNSNQNLIQYHQSSWNPPQNHNLNQNQNRPGANMQEYETNQVHNPPSKPSRPQGPSLPQPPFNPMAHNANNYFNIASQNGQFHNFQQFNSPQNQPSQQYPYQQYSGRNEYDTQPQPTKNENETSANQRLFDNVQNNIIIQHPPGSVTSTPSSMDLEPPKNPTNQELLFHNQQRTTLLNPDLNKIPNNIDIGANNYGVAGVNPNLEHWVGVTNLYKLNYEANKRGLIELTYLLQRPNQMLYQPFYVVKYVVPYITYLNHLKQSLKNRPYMRSDPAKLYDELVPNSNITEVSPDLKHLDENSIKNWVLRSGSLYKAKIVDQNLTKVDDHVKMVHDLTSNMSHEELSKILDNMIKVNNKTEPNNESSDYSVKPIETTHSEPGFKKSQENQHPNRRFMLPINFRQGQYSPVLQNVYRRDSPNDPVPQIYPVPTNNPPPQNYQPPQIYTRPLKYPPPQNNLAPQNPTAYKT